VALLALAPVSLWAGTAVAGREEHGSRTRHTRERQEELNPISARIPGSGRVTRERFEGGRFLHADLPGRLLGYALLRRGDGGRDVVFLVAPEEAPAEKAEDEDPHLPRKEPCPPGAPDSQPPPEPLLLVKLAVKDEPDLVTLRADIQADAFGIDAADVDGDGIDEILLLRPGELSIIRDGGIAEERAAGIPPLAAPGLADGELDPWLVRFPALATEGFFPLASLDGLRIYGPLREHAGLGLRSSRDLALEARLARSSLILEGSPVRPVGRSSDGRLWLASGPSGGPGRRLRTLLFDALDGGESGAAEIWSRLPEPEHVMESFFLIFDGRPALLVTTRSAEKLKLFAEKRLRLFLLEGADRSRAGSPPLLSVDSNANLWQGIFPAVADVSGDGLEDLVLVYWKGLKESSVVLEAWLRAPGGGFESSPATTRFDVEEASRDSLAYGMDLDGDSLPELILAAGGRIRIHRGLRPARSGSGLVEHEARWSLPGGDLSWQAGATPVGTGIAGVSFGPDGDGERGMGTPRLVDVDGDGRSEILSLATSGEAGGRFRITWLER